MTSRHITECIAAGIPVGPNGGLLGHDFVPDSQSGAGNCVCGRPYRHSMHNQYSPEGDCEVEGMPVLIHGQPWRPSWPLPLNQPKTGNE